MNGGNEWKGFLGHYIFKVLREYSTNSIGHSYYIQIHTNTYIVHIGKGT